MTTYAKLVQGETVSLDYTPGSAVSAGDVIVLGANVFFATKDIAANALGSIEIEGQWKLPKETGTAHNQGDRVFWDAVNHRVTKTAASNQALGFVAKAAGSSDTTGVYQSVMSNGAVLSS